MHKTRVSRLSRRIGCALLLILWFAFLLLPCALFALARDGRIVLKRSALPGDDLLRVQLIMDREYSGIALSSGRPSRSDDRLRACVYSAVRYIFWRGAGIAPARYCECYSRANGDANWRLANDGGGPDCQAQD